MKPPENQVELEAILAQATADGDERAVMLARFAESACQHLETKHAALGLLLDDAQVTLDAIEGMDRRGGLLGNAYHAKLQKLLRGLTGQDPSGGTMVGGVTETADGAEFHFQSHWSLRLAVYAMKKSIQKPDGTFWNSIQMTFCDPDPAIGALLVILQRQTGETPQQRIDALKYRVRELEQQVQELQNEIKASTIP